MAIFPPSLKENLWKVVEQAFTGQMCFLLPNHQCQSTGEHMALTLIGNLALSFFHPLSGS